MTGFLSNKVAPRLATLSISDTGSRSLFSTPIHHGRPEKLPVNPAFLISLDRNPFRGINSRSEEKYFRGTSAPWEANGRRIPLLCSKACGITQNSILSSGTVSTPVGTRIHVYFQPNPVLISRLHEPVSLIELHSGHTENRFLLFTRREMMV